MTIRTRITLAGIGLVLAGGLSVLSGTGAIALAHADPQSYIDKLTAAGISTPRGEYELKEWGYAVCGLRARGFPPKKWVEQAVYQDALHPPYGLTEQQANTIVDTAVSELCDDRDGPGPHIPPY